jgi:hypothetical protein
MRGAATFAPVASSGAAADPAAAPLRTRTLFLVAVASFGGPLALAALYAPGEVSDVTGSGGLVTVLALVAFLAPLTIWLRYARDVTGAGGLTSYVEAAAGRKVALAQAALWTSSYTLYLLYTSAYVVYDILPVAWPGVHAYRPALAVALPVALAAVVVSGRRAAMSVIAGFAVLQLAVVVLLDVVSVAHAPGATAFGAPGSTTELGRATGGVASLFVCGSLPLFLGGEVRNSGRAFRRVLPAAYLVTGAVVLLAVYPLARDPAFARAAIPGVALAEIDVGHPAGVAVGLGVAASVVALMVLEYVALTRLLHAVTARPVQSWARWLAVPLVVAGPISLINPERFYADLLKPSLVLLWLAQLVVVAVYPAFIARRRKLRMTDIGVTLVAAALILYALHTTVFGHSGT